MISLMRRGESNYHVGDVVCKVDILLWSGRGIASYALKLEYQRKAWQSAGAANSAYRLITDSGSRGLHLGCRTRP